MMERDIAVKGATIAQAPEEGKLTQGALLSATRTRETYGNFCQEGICGEVFALSFPGEERSVVLPRFHF